MRFGRMLVGGAVVTVTFALGVSTAHAETTRCKAAVVRNASKFVQAKANALANCERNIISGKLPASTDCHAEAKTAAVAEPAS